MFYVSVLKKMEKKISREELVQDIRQLSNLLENAHPDPYINGGGKIKYNRRLQKLIRDVPFDGMTKQINTLSNLGLLSRFIGMTTDSRSFLSFPRHEYFRRILCNLIGNDVENGEIPGDMDLLGNIVENISYHNAVDYFKML